MYIWNIYNELSIKNEFVFQVQQNSIWTGVISKQVNCKIYSQFCEMRWFISVRLCMNYLVELNIKIKSVAHSFQEVRLCVNEQINRVKRV